MNRIATLVVFAVAALSCDNVVSEDFAPYLAEPTATSLNPVARDFRPDVEIPVVDLATDGQPNASGAAQARYLDASGEITALQDGGWFYDADGEESDTHMTLRRGEGWLRWRGYWAGAVSGFEFNSRHIDTEWPVWAAIIDVQGRAWVSFGATSVPKDQPPKGHGVGVYSPDGELLLTFETAGFEVMDAFDDKVLLALGGEDFGTSVVRRVPGL